MATNEKNRLLDKYDPMMGDEIAVTSITYINNNNISLSKSEYKILEIMEINMKPTWNSIELTAEDIKNKIEEHKKRKKPKVLTLNGFLITKEEIIESGLVITII